MKILVAVKRTIDPNIKINVKSDLSNVELNNVKMAINPFCEIAVEEAIRLKEAGHATEVIVVSIGSKASQEQLRTALALGADKALLIETELSLEPINIAKILNQLVQEQNIDLVLLGKQSIDSDNNQTGQMLAALGDMPQGTFASQILIEKEQIKITREVDGGSQTLALTLPAIITTDLRLNEPRYASLPNIMKAKRKPLQIIPLNELGISIEQHTRLLSVTPPAQRQSGIIVNSVDELLEKLKQEAKVL